MQARVAFEQKNYQKAEGHLLRADRPDLVAKFYKASPASFSLPLLLVQVLILRRQICGRMP